VTYKTDDPLPFTCEEKKLDSWKMYIFNGRLTHLQLTAMMQSISSLDNYAEFPDNWISYM